MKLNQSINELVNPTKIDTIKMTFAEMQRKLLGEFTSSVKALDVGFDTFLDNASTSLGTLYPAQRTFLHDLHKELQNPNAVVDVRTARQVGTTTSLLLYAYFSLLQNPHQNIVFMYHNKNAARAVANQFNDIVSLMEAEHNFPKVFTKYTKESMTTQYNGRITFLTGRTPDSLRGQTITKLFAEDYNNFANERFEQTIVPLLASGTDLITTNVGAHATLPTNIKRHLVNRDWDDNPNHDLEYFDRMRVQMGDHYFNLEMNL